MLSSLVKGVVEKHLDMFARKVIDLAESVSNVAFAIQRLSDVVKKQQQMLLDHQQAILQNTITLELITKKMKSSGLNTELPDIKFDDGDGEPN